MVHLRGTKRPSHNIVHCRVSRESIDGVRGVVFNITSVFFRGGIDVSQRVGRYGDEEGRLRLLVFPVAVLDICAVRLVSPHLERYRVTEHLCDAHADRDDPFVHPVAGWDILDADSCPSLREA